VKFGKRKERMMEKWITIQPDGRNLMEILSGQFIELPSFCAGKGICGKCKIHVLQNGVESVELACQYIPDKICQVKVQEETEKFYVETINTEEKRKIERDVVTEGRTIVVDIGTTTIAMLLLNQQGKILCNWTGLNPQRKYGADVISRMEKAQQGFFKELTDCIRKEILIGMKALCKTEYMSEKMENRKIEQVILAGNTTMQHLFAGYPVEGLGKYPFQPYQAEWFSGKLTEFFPAQSEFLFELPEELSDTSYVMMPCISAFIGGDIMAGMLEVEAIQKQKGERKGNENQKSENWLLLDLGTNGELVLYSNGVYYAASTAAGPVFEGGSIHCGMGSIAGAIDHIWEEKGELCYSTIGGKSPVGICGTGLIDGIAALRKLGILDKDGMLKGYSNKGYTLARDREGKLIQIMQEDVRQFQLAKAALRAGMEILCRVAEIKMEDLEQVYLAGGFGTQLDIRRSCEAELIPIAWKRKCLTLGNTALKGCCTYCIEEEAKEQLEEMKKNSKTVLLELEEEFQERYLYYINFSNGK